jgi:hypothetical protein
MKASFLPCWSSASWTTPRSQIRSRFMSARGSR